MSVAFNVNENFSLSWAELTETYDANTNAAAGRITDIADVDMDSTSIQFAYTMGSMKIAGNRNEIVNSQGATGASAKDEMTEIIEALPLVKKKILTSATQRVKVPAFVGLLQPKRLNFLLENSSQLQLKEVVSPTQDKQNTLLQLLQHRLPRLRVRWRS